MVIYEDFCPRTYHYQILVDGGFQPCHCPKGHAEVLPDVKKRHFCFLFYLSRGNLSFWNGDGRRLFI